MGWQDTFGDKNARKERCQGRKRGLLKKEDILLSKREEIRVNRQNQAEVIGKNLDSMRGL
jgi:hypothetical protein